MKPRAFITTSWDDGHPLDFRIAEMLEANGLAGTFYIPKTSQTPTMSERDVRELSSRFEIGAHTIDHTFLDAASDCVAEREIVDSKAWVEQTTGRPCRMFCPPAGKFSPRDVRFVRQAGYLGLRSVELMSLAAPRERDSILVMPTTLQAHPHRPPAYLKNAIRRRSAGNLWNFISCGLGRSWHEAAIALLDRALARGGVFHLWGHSWEIEQTGQWDNLAQVLRLLGERRSQAAVLSNSQVCESLAQPSQLASPAARPAIASH